MITFKQILIDLFNEGFTRPEKALSLLGVVSLAYSRRGVEVGGEMPNVQEVSDLFLAMGGQTSGS